MGYRLEIFTLPDWTGPNASGVFAAIFGPPHGGRRASTGERTDPLRHAFGPLPIDGFFASAETGWMPTSYDQVLYPSAVYSYTHPDLFAAIAALAGMKPVPVDRARVLELGCGDGLNLISMACSLPESQFVGIDLAEQPIARGQAIIDKLGQKNITLAAQDVADAGAELGEFDYIIVHGLYSWVPPHVREKVMEICGKHLSADGIAYVSYNAFPGNHFRDAIRGMMRYHISHFDNPQDQVGQARGLVKLLAEGGEESDPYRKVLGRELERITSYTDSAFFHDDLSSINQSFYFHEFMAHAQQHGLQYLAEADHIEKQEVPCAPKVRSVLAQLDPRDIIAGEQYRDFIRCRAFRRTLLCHREIALQRNFSPERMRDLWLCGEIRSTTPPGQEVEADAPEIFTGSKKSEFETPRPLVKAALRRLGAEWPGRIHFRDLVALARSDLGRTGEEGWEPDADELAVAMQHLVVAGAADLRSHHPHCLLEPGPRPMASRLARAQIEFGPRVATQLHGLVQIEDDLSRFLLTLLDGTRDRAELCAALQTAVRAGQVQLNAITPEQITEEELDVVLRKLARLGLIVA